MDYITESINNIEFNHSIIPNGCLSFSEMAQHINVFTQNEFATLLESIGLEELAVYENTGSAIYYEGTTLADLRNKFKDKMKQVFAVIKSFWDKVIREFAALDMSVRRYKLIEYLNTLDPKDLKGKYGNINDFTFVGKIDYNKNTNTFLKQVDKVYTQLIKSRADGDQVGQATMKLEAAVNEAISSVPGDKNSQMKKNLKNKLLGEKIIADKDWVNKNYSNMVEILSNGASTKKIKALYIQERDLIADITRKLDNLDADMYDIALMWATIIGLVVGTLHMCYACEMDVYKQRYVQYTKVAMNMVKETGALS